MIQVNFHDVCFCFMLFGLRYVSFWWPLQAFSTQGHPTDLSKHGCCCCCSQNKESSSAPVAGVPVWTGGFWKLRTNLFKFYNKRVCVCLTYLKRPPNAYVFGAWKRQTRMCLLGYGGQTRMCVECVWIVFGCVWYAYIKLQTRMCLVSEQQTRMCLPLHLFKNPTNAYVFGRCIANAYVSGANHINFHQKKTLLFVFSSSSCQIKWMLLQLMLNKNIYALGHKKQKKAALYTVLKRKTKKTWF